MANNRCEDGSGTLVTCSGLSWVKYRYSFIELTSAHTIVSNLAPGPKPTVKNASSFKATKEFNGSHVVAGICVPIVENKRI